MSQVEYVGYFVLAAVIVVGLFFTVTKPMTENTRQMTELTVELKNQREWQKSHEKEFKEQIAKNSGSHERIWKHNDEQDKTLQDHEKRITILENKGDD